MALLLEGGRLRMVRPPTRLQRFIDELGLRVLEIVREANRIALEQGIDSISRKHFMMIRQGRAHATEERIYIIVAAIQSVTGMLVRASDLFVLQPATPAPSNLPWETLGPRSRDGLSVFSSRWFSGALWSTGRTLPDQFHPANAQEFEALYTECGVLLRSIAIHRYNIPPDDTEALVHDILMSYLQRWEYLRELKGWLIGAIGSASRTTCGAGNGKSRCCRSMSRPPISRPRRTRNPGWST